jgi:anaerobic magnesium-protoporphyrin IX monomethyl ester cyclase
MPLAPASMRRTHRVNLVNPPSAAGTTANREGAAGMGVVYPHRDAFLYPPHGLATAAAGLRDAGYQVQAFDGVVEELTPDLAEADAIGVFVAFASLDTDLDFIGALRQQSTAKLVAFGPAMRFVAQQVLNRAPVDAVLTGEAEGFFPEALQHLDAQAVSSAAGVLTPSTVGAPGYDGEGFVDPLDRLPFPAWDMLPYERYRLLTVLSSRGCPDECTYCPYAAAQGHRFRARSIANVLAELAWLNERFHPPRLVFRDAVFAHNRERVGELCTGMLSRGLALRWECESRPEHFDVGLLRLMQRAGCQWVKIGLETTEAALLMRLGRIGSLEQAEGYLQHVAKVVRTCAEIGLRCRLFVMAGLPGQDVAMAQRTREFVEQLRPAALNVKACDRHPGLGLDMVDEGDSEAQMEVLLQAQMTVQAHQPSLPLLIRGRRWLQRMWRGESNG